MESRHLHVIFLLVFYIKHTQAEACTCDLTAHGCDINCCCDPDCTEEDKKVFSKCIKLNNEHVTEICVSDSVLFSANGKYQIEGSGSGLLCLYKNNYNARFFYSDVTAVKDHAAFERLASKYRKTAYSIETETKNVYEKSFKVGDPLFISVSTNQRGLWIPGFLPQPISFLTNECEDSNPARFLHSEKSQCFRLVKNLEKQCGAERSWNAVSYHKGYAVAPYPSFIFGEKRFVEVTNSTVALNKTTPTAVNNSKLITPHLLESKCRAPSGEYIQCPFSPINLPQHATYDKSNSQCNNVVQEVTYSISYRNNITVEITEVNVTITFTNVSTSFLQGSLFTFKAEENITDAKNTTTTYMRSGNPGYVIGLPVVVAVVEGTVVYPSYLNSTVHWSTMKATSDGMCNAAGVREAINFGFDLRTGCLVTIENEMTLKKCEQLQNVINQTLLGKLPTHVASFGNPDDKKISDWITVINVIPKSKITISNGQCFNMHTSILFEFLYTSSGFLTNAQRKIIGVQVKYPAARDLLSQCFGLFCDSSKKQKIEIVQSVSFVDVSSTPQAEIKSKPQFKSKAPHNFFYPFFT